MSDRMIGLTFYVLLALLVFSMFVMVPVAFVTKANCLEHGYPESAVTWNLKRYCLNLEGAVTVKVSSLDEVVE